MTTEEKNLQLQIRCLTSNVYDLQKLRISVGNRLVQSFYIQMGVEPSKKIDEADEGCKNLLKELEKEYNLVSDLMAENNKSIKKQIATMPKDKQLQYIRNELDYKLISQYESLRDAEKETTKVLAKYVQQHPMWDKFFAGVKGCGELMAANCISYLDIEKARHVSSFWKYCGLDTVPTKDEKGEYITDDEGNIVYHGRKMGDTEMFDYTDKDGNIKQKRGITYNPDLKCKLMGVLSGCIIKAGQRNGYNKYEECYRDYKNRLANSPRHQDKSAGHINNMALRYMIKQFLRDLWVTWREYEGYEVTEPYEVAYLGRKPHKYNEAQVEAASRTKK